MQIFQNFFQEFIIFCDSSFILIIKYLLLRGRQQIVYIAQKSFSQFSYSG